MIALCFKDDLYAKLYYPTGTQAGMMLKKFKFVTLYRSSSNGEEKAIWICYTKPELYSEEIRIVFCLWRSNTVFENRRRERRGYFNDHGNIEMRPLGGWWKYIKVLRDFSIVIFHHMSSKGEVLPIWLVILHRSWAVRKKANFRLVL